MEIDLAPKIKHDPKTRVMDYIEQTYTFEEWFRCGDVSDAVGAPERTIRGYLSDMVNRGILKKRGEYKATEYAIAGTYAQKLKALQEIPDTALPIADKGQNADSG